MESKYTDDRRIVDKAALMLSDMERLLIDVAHGKERDEMYDKARVEGRYECIPMYQEEFIPAVGVAHELWTTINRGVPKFLDVGCGVGFKVFMASRLGYLAAGIEADARYIERSPFAALSVSRNMEFIVGDGRTFPNYNSYDVIYCFCPMVDRKLQIELEKAIYDGAKDGAILLQALKMNRDSSLEPNLWQLGRIGDVRLLLKTEDKRLACAMANLLPSRWRNPDWEKWLRPEAIAVSVSDDSLDDDDWDDDVDVE